MAHKTLGVACIVLCLILVLSHPARGKVQNPKILLDRTLPEVIFKDNALSDAIEFLRDATGVNIYVDWHALDAAKIQRDTAVTVNLRKTKLSEIVRKMLDSASDQAQGGKLQFSADEQIMIIGTQSTVDRFEAFDRTHKRPDATSGQDPLDKPIKDLRFNANSLADAFDFLKESTGASITVDWDSLHQAGMGLDETVTLRLWNVTGAEALKMILINSSNQQANLDYTTRDKGIVIRAVATKTTHP